jgi:organic hydroperoxide reductase OsmC/OhrA
MNISAQVTSSYRQHQVTLATDGTAHSLGIPPKSSGYGSSANGGELLLLALATCYCNDIYREAAKRGIKVEQVEVEATAKFGGEGEPASDLTYRARVVAHATEAEIRELCRRTDLAAEIQNTLRASTSVTLGAVEAVAAET